MELTLFALAAVYFISATILLIAGRLRRGAQRNWNFRQGTYFILVGTALVAAARYGLSRPLTVGILIACFLLFALSAWNWRRQGEADPEFLAEDEAGVKRLRNHVREGTEPEAPV